MVKANCKHEDRAGMRSHCRLPGLILWVIARLISTTRGIYISCVCSHQSGYVPSYRQQQENSLFWGKFLRTASNHFC